jgi:hypothetical protein
MKRYNRTILFGILFAASLLCSCQQVVDVDLNTTAPHIVIEGRVTDQPGPYTVTISQTADFFEPVLLYPPVTGALVVIADNAGNVDTLIEIGNGSYQTSTLQGVAGRTYVLTVTRGGKTYSGVSTIPTRVTIDSFTAENFTFLNGDKGYKLSTAFTDPPGTQDYYRLVLHINSLPQDSVDGGSYFLFKDELTNGTTITQDIRIWNNIFPGDTVSVDLMHIDEATYEYFTTLQNIVNGGINAPASPANPTTDLSGGALGYFAAYTLDSAKIILH